MLAEQPPIYHREPVRAMLRVSEPERSLVLWISHACRDRIGSGIISRADRASLVHSSVKLAAEFEQLGIVAPVVGHERRSGNSRCRDCSRESRGECSTCDKSMIRAIPTFTELVELLQRRARAFVWFRLNRKCSSTTVAS